jgi:hypothetical protein
MLARRPVWNHLAKEIPVATRGAQARIRYGTVSPETPRRGAEQRWGRSCKSPVGCLEASTSPAERGRRGPRKWYTVATEPFPEPSNHRRMDIVPARSRRTQTILTGSKPTNPVPRQRSRRRCPSPIQVTPETIAPMRAGRDGSTARDRAAATGEDGPSCRASSRDIFRGADRGER